MQVSVESCFEVVSTLSQAPSIGYLGDGEMLLLHSNYPDCMAGEVLFLRQSIDGGRSWSAPIHEIRSTPFKGGVEGTLSVCGDLCLIAYLEGSDLKRCPANPKRVSVIRSMDRGKTWCSPSLLPGHPSAMPFGKIIRLEGSGRLLLPVWGFVAWLDRAAGSAGTTIYASDDEGVSWYEFGRILPPESNGHGNSTPTETEIHELENGTLIAVSRADITDSDSFPYGLASRSLDGGRSWDRFSATNIHFCEPRLKRMPDGTLLLAARSWPGNLLVRYRPLRPEEREPGSFQTETIEALYTAERRSPVRAFGVSLFTSTDGLEWRHCAELPNPRSAPDRASLDPLAAVRALSAYPDLCLLGENKILVVYRQPDSTMPDLRPGLTYSHVFQRFLAASIVQLDPGEGPSRSNSSDSKP